METLIKLLTSTKKGQKIYTYIKVDFEYSESCTNVYKHFSVAINNKNSNFTGLKKYLKKLDAIPSIIAANCYFWHPSSSASCRRYNESKRENEVREYFESEGFAAKGKFMLRPNFLLKKESAGIDNLGTFVKVKSEIFHLNNFKELTEKDAEYAREEILKRRRLAVEKYLAYKQMLSQRKEQEAKREELQAQIKEQEKFIFVTFNDSVKAGNCVPGTRQFYDSIPLVQKGLHIHALRADVLLSLRNDTYTNAAVQEASKRLLPAIVKQ